MNPGELKTVLSFQVVTSVIVNGDSVETLSTPVLIRGKLKQLQGYDKMLYTELVTKDVYEFKCYDNVILTKDAVCTLGTIVFTVYEIVKNPGQSATNEVRLILYNK